MATANPVRNHSHVSSDRSGSCSDDVVSLDSWSEKLDTNDWSTEFDSTRSRPPSVGRADMSRLRHHSGQPTPNSEVTREKVLRLKSAPPGSRNKSHSQNSVYCNAIPSISSAVQNREHTHGVLTYARQSGSSNSSDSESSPLHSPRHRGTSPHSRRIPQSGTHHFQYHLQPHYQSSPLHRGSPGHLASSSPHRHDSQHVMRGHPHHGQEGVGSRPHHQPHHGVPYYAQQLGHQNNYTLGNNAALDQIIEREGEKLKTKMKSMWNNVKYGWTLKTKTSFKYDSPIFLLGRCYHRRADAEEEQQALRPMPPQQQYKVSALDEFHADFTSRLWFTYRREFSPIGSAKMTTDCGWGCMLRSGQMMIAQGLVLHFLRRDWKVYSEQKPEDLAFYREIVRWFGDHPSNKMPFALHRLVELGTSVGKMPGDWYGPASVAHIFRDAMDKAHASLPILSNICVYVAQDCTIYLEDVKKVMSSHNRSDSTISAGSEGEHPHPHHRPSSTSSSSSSQQQQQRGGGGGGGGHLSDSLSEEKFRSVLILVPMRLGGELLNEIYVPCVKSMLAHDSCIGIIGGRPKHSLYFVGWQDDKLIYLDPHYCQDTVDTTQSLYPIQSFHCMSPRKMVFNKMDPSCTVGFYCRTLQDLRTFVDQVPDMVVPPGQKGQYPLFVVSDSSSADLHVHHPPVRELGRLRIRHVHTDAAGNRVRSNTLDSEDFVIL